jgi:HEAT repeat protein
MRAVYILGQIGGDDAIDPLYTLLKKTDKMDYKRSIIFALGCFKKKALVFFEDEIDSDSYITRADVAEILGFTACHEAIDPLLELSKDKEELVRGKAVLALGRLGFSDKKALDALKQALADRDNFVRMSGASAFDLLKWKFKDNRELASYYAAKQQWNKVIELKGASSDALLIAMKDRKEWIRRSAAATLVEIGPAAVEGLSSDVDMNDPRMLSTLLLALGKIKSPKALPLMEKTAEHPDWLVRNSTARALRHIPSAKTLVLLKKLSNDPERIVRTNAMKSLGRARNYPVGELLASGMKDSEWLVRKNSAESLGRTGDEKYIPDLKRALCDPNELVRAGSAKSLAKLKWAPQSEKEKLDYYFATQDWGKLKKMSKGILLELQVKMEDKNSAIRCKIIETIGKIGAPESVAYLRETLINEKAYDVKKASAKALLNYGVKAVPAYSIALEAGDPLARKLSAEYLGLVKY